MKFLSIATLILSILYSLPSHAEDTPIKIFYTGNDYLKTIGKYSNMKGIEKLYISGINDSLILFHAAGVEQINGCTINKTQSQLAAIFLKWLQSNPERWHEPAPLLYLDAIKKSCGIK